MTYAFIISILFMGGLVLHAFRSSSKAKKENARRRAEAVRLNEEERQRKIYNVRPIPGQTYTAVKQTNGKYTATINQQPDRSKQSDDTLLNTVLATAVINDSFISSDSSSNQDSFSGGGGEFGGGGSSGSWDTGSSSSYDSGSGFDSGSSGSFGSD